MMYKKTSPRFQVSNADLKLQRRVVLLLCAALLAAAVAMGVYALRGRAYQDRVNMQFQQRMYSACNAAVDEVNKLGSIVTSNASAQLSRVRQYIYYMEQLNAMSISLAGGEKGRFLGEEAFTALYADLDQFESLIQQSTTSTLDARTQLLTHLSAVQLSLTQ